MFFMYAGLQHFGSMKEDNKALECPFTWGLDQERVKMYKVGYDDDIPDEVNNEYPFTPLADSIMHVFSWTIQNDLSKAEDEMRHMLNIWNSLDRRMLEKDEISIEVVEHIMRSTQYHLYVKLGRMEEAEDIIQKLQDSFSFKSKKELATIYGCKSISWYQFGIREKHAALLARTAVMINPQCSAWQHQLGRTLCNTRRTKLHGPPTDEEVGSLLKAYELSNNPYYAIKAALALKENKRYDEENKILAQVYEMEPKHPSIRLRLALCFLGKWDFNKAKKCLDYVETKIPESPLLLHHRGLFYEKKKKYEEAAIWYKKSADLGSFIGNLQYAKCQLKIDVKFKYIEYLTNMVEKYNEEHKKQKLLLQIGVSFYSLRQNITKSVKYILDGFEKDTDNVQLFENFYDATKNAHCNILNLLDQTLLPKYVKSNNRKKMLMKENSLKILKKIHWDWSEDWWSSLDSAEVNNKQELISDQENGND
ncbi:hypothetical protein QAD02_022870 [Eretmocerus hayati]|uniref:Uncharacterized protein n=1 Tax=Eretmocerus hayati TaxID=131215 RepID=A0ACC2PVW0_9HYME|nr:hypothetical protein QAD02_022870 [Eretmocerus hayati]